jgi:hypothetical protein
MNNEPVGVVTEFEGMLVGTLFEQLPDGTKLYTHPAKTLTDEEIDMLRKHAKEIEYWKSAFERAMSLYDQVKHLEAQVYGGTTK